VKFAYTLDLEGKYKFIDGEEVPCDYREPDFARYDKATKHVHEWLHYISPALRELWPTFTDEQKAVIAANAESTASNENWD
jgi:hypothetical protein